ncbi:MAG: TonB-dependent receptor, partial [Bacteroidota bacterium]
MKESFYPCNQRRALLWSLLMLAIVLPTQAQRSKVTLSGYITDEASDESLIGANIWCPTTEQGASANAFGFYSLTLTPGTYTLEVSAIGYTPKTLKVTLSENQTLNLQLAEATQQLEEVVVNGKQSAVQLTQMSRRTLPIDQLDKLPTFFGEVDVLKSVQMMPGVLRGSEGNNGLYVRGGSADQNLMLLDGVPVYNANHVFGFLSVFNADAIKSVEVYTGGFPARYGGRLSSVIDVIMREGSREKLQGLVSVGLISSRAMLEGPIGENTSFLVTARRSYADLFAIPFLYFRDLNSSFGQNSVRANFQDFNGKINHRFSDRSRLYLSAYTGQDVYAGLSKNEVTSEAELRNFDWEEGTRWGNVTTALRWNYVLSPQLFMNLTGTYSRYGFGVLRNTNEYRETLSTGEVKHDFYYENQTSVIQDLGAKLDFDWAPNPSNHIKFGAQLTRQFFQPGDYSLQSTMLADTLFGAAERNGWFLNGYVEDEIQLGDKVSANLGLHASQFETGDTTYRSLQPRLSMRAQVHPQVAIKASYTQMQQPLHLLVTSGIGLPVDQWVPATDRVAPQESWQVAAGVDVVLGEGYLLSLEGFYKEMDNVLEYLDGEGYTNPYKDWQDKIAVGTGTGYGGELWLKKEQGAFTGWLAYTLSWSWRKFDEINFGERFPYRYDRRHNIQLAGTYQVREGMTVGANWQYGTGHAITLPVGLALLPDAAAVDEPFAWANNPRFYPYYGGRNNFRMPDYHRLDVSMNFEKHKSRGVRVWSFGAYNAYGRQNPLFITLDTFTNEENGVLVDIEKVYQQFTPIPFPIPYASY